MQILAPDFDTFYREFRSRVRSDVFVVDQAVRYIARRRGKALRPFLVLASARLLGQPQQATFRACLIVELLHTATLIHDDVVDRATMRRGFPSLHTLWGNKFSVLFGDYLLAHSLAAILEERSLPWLDILSETAKRMSRGQLLELSRARRGDLSEESYFDMIADKTAALMCACCQLGALSLGANGSVRQALAEYGEYVGIAFQIRDDLLDYTGRPRFFGKRIGEDIRDKKTTLPFIAALQSAGNGEKNRMLALLRTGIREKDIPTVVRFVEGNGGLGYAQSKAAEYAKRAEESLLVFPDSPSKNTLLQFIQYAIRRQK
ncbi:MAG: polyprenyl synthetase family protein [bacterium]